MKQKKVRWTTTNQRTSKQGMFLINLCCKDALEIGPKTSV